MDENDDDDDDFNGPEKHLQGMFNRKNPRA